MTRALNASQHALLDTVERAARSIAHPLSCAGCFNRQLAHALEMVGVPSTAEVVVPGTHLRCDLVLVTPSGNCVVECDGDRVRPGTLQKFRLVPDEVLRVLVLRNRRQRPVVPFCDRVVCMSTSYRPLGWLTEGTVGHLHDMPRLGPRSADRPGQLLLPVRVRR